MDSTLKRDKLEGRIHKINSWQNTVLDRINYETGLRHLKLKCFKIQIRKYTFQKLSESLNLFLVLLK